MVRFRIRRRLVALALAPALAAGLLAATSWSVAPTPASAAVANISPVVSSVSRSANKLDAFGVDAGGRIYTAAWEPDFTDGWHRWAQINGGIAAAGSSVYAVSRRTDYLDVFAVGSDRQVYTAAWQPSDGPKWRGWWPIAGLKVAANTSVHAVSSRTDRIDLFAVGEDRYARTANWTPATGWTGWTKLGSGDDTISAGSTVFAVSRAPGKIDLFAPVTYYRYARTASWDAATGTFGGWRNISGTDVRVTSGGGIHAVSAAGTSSTSSSSLISAAGCTPPPGSRASVRPGRPGGRSATWPRPAAPPRSPPSVRPTTSTCSR